MILALQVPRHLQTLQLMLHQEEQDDDAVLTVLLYHDNGEDAECGHRSLFGGYKNLVAELESHERRPVGEWLLIGKLISCPLPDQLLLIDDARYAVGNRPVFFYRRPVGDQEASIATAYRLQPLKPVGEQTSSSCPPTEDRQ